MSIAAEEVTFDLINVNAQPYPAFMLPEGGTALSLFAAGFHGWNDVIHMARKHMTVTCVDTDVDKLFQMARIYPDPWEFHAGDAWTFATDAIAGRKPRSWDVVSVDPYMGDTAEKARDTLALWCQLATKLVTLTVDMAQPLWAPPGWTAEIFARNEKVGWMVLHHA